MDVVIEILKWTTVIFVAGFIGQFGKSLTLWLLKRARERKANEAKAKVAPAMEKKAPGPVEPLIPEQEKLDKKAAKAEMKRLKKEAKAEEKRAKEEAKAGVELPADEPDTAERRILDEAFEAVDSAYEDRPPHVTRRESPEPAEEPDKPEPMLE
jgi:hypothetical protein